MKKTRVAINGFGRIGRTLTSILLSSEAIELVVVNDLHDAATMAHLFKFDSVHGSFNGSVSSTADALILNGKPIRYITEKSAVNLPWRAMDIDVVVECTGTMKSRAQLEQHLQAGARKVLLSAPSEDDTVKTIVPGVNLHLLQNDDSIVSAASCTTNNAAPMIALLHEAYQIEQCYITTVHSYTGDQRLHDAPHKDLRRSRAAALNIIPTTTGAAKALTRVFPQLAGHMGGCGIRVPVPNGSLTDITCTVKQNTTVTDVNELFKTAASGHMKGILEYTEAPVVSSDIIGNTHSCVFDAQLTSVIGRMVKVVGWYDNETGYSHRLVDMIVGLSAS